MTHSSSLLRVCGVVAVVTCTACAESKPQEASRAAGSFPSASRPVPIGQLPDIDMTAVLAHTKMLSSDEFEGRAPGSSGEEKTVAYLIDEFKKVGLKPGNTDG